MIKAFNNDLIFLIMKNVLKFGKALNKAEQKQIHAGFGGQYYNGGCMSNCPSRCYQAMVLFGSIQFECVDVCSSPTLKECRIYI